MRVQDPSWLPGTNQIFGSVKLTKAKNPQIKDTANREGLKDNDAYKDMIDFLKNSIKIFRSFRREAEYDGNNKKKKPTPEQMKKVEKVIRNKKRSDRNTTKDESFLDFSRQYPEIFYKKLEDEINQCFKYRLPNATLILCRKMVENLLYNILYYKYPKEVNLRYDTKQGRPQNFSVLLNNLESKKSDFKNEQSDLLGRCIALIKPFVRHANSKTHNIMEYLDDISQLNKFKIPEIIQILLKLIHNINNVEKSK